LRVWSFRSPERFQAPDGGDDRGFPLSFGGTKEEALGKARRLLQKYQQRVWTAFGEMSRDVKEYEEKKRQEREAWLIQRRAEQPEPIKSIPKRRRQIFEASEGKCHYCRTVLTIDGKWHIEHKMPKALLGGNEPGNLVASCVTCNHRKNDKTDVEFKAQLIREAA
jgi:5-methylcytosine-specific restriction endonuclease McrA